MHVGINIRHQNGAVWSDVLDGVLEAERLGFDSAFFPDHLVPIEYMRAADGATVLGDIVSASGPSDAWTLIAALTPITSRIHLGTMMTSSTFRAPGVLAVVASQLNEMSDGRIEVGLGTNWHDAEHAMFGLPFPVRSERFARLAEQLALVTTFWNTAETDTFSTSGGFYDVTSAPGLARAGRTRPRLILGGTGLVKTPKLIARFADEANMLVRTPEEGAAFRDACTHACEDIGRDPSSLRWSVLLSIAVSEDDADLRRHLAAAGMTPEQLVKQFVCRPPQLVELLEEWRITGVDRVVLSRPGSVDLPSLQLIGDRVLPALAKGDQT